MTFDEMAEREASNLEFDKFKVIWSNLIVDQDQREPVPTINPLITDYLIAKGRIEEF